MRTSSKATSESQGPRATRLYSIAQQMFGERNRADDKRLSRQYASLQLDHVTRRSFRRAAVAEETRYLRQKAASIIAGIERPSYMQRQINGANSKDRPRRLQADTFGNTYGQDPYATNSNIGNSTNSHNSSHEVSNAVWIGLSFGVAIVGLIIVGCVLWCCREASRKRALEIETMSKQQSLQDGRSHASRVGSRSVVSQDTNQPRRREYQDSLRANIVDEPQDVFRRSVLHFSKRFVKAEFPNDVDEGLDTDELIYFKGVRCPRRPSGGTNALHVLYMEKAMIYGARPTKRQSLGRNEASKRGLVQPHPKQRSQSLIMPPSSRLEMPPEQTRQKSDCVVSELLANTAHDKQAMNLDFNAGERNPINEPCVLYRESDHVNPSPAAANTQKYSPPEQQESEQSALAVRDTETQVITANRKNEKDLKLENPIDTEFCAQRVPSSGEPEATISLGEHRRHRKPKKEKKSKHQSTNDTKSADNADKLTASKRGTMRIDESQNEVAAFVASYELRNDANNENKRSEKEKKKKSKGKPETDKRTPRVDAI